MGLGKNVGRTLIPLVAVAGILFLKFAVPELGAPTPFVLFSLAVGAVAIYLGFAAGVVVSVFLGLVGHYLRTGAAWLEPRALGEGLSSFMFVLEGCILSGMISFLGSRRFRAEERNRLLEESETRFRTLANAMPHVVWTAQPDGTVDYYNERVAEYRGFRRVSDARWEWSPVLHPDDVTPTEEAWSHALRTGEPYQCEHRVRRVDGEFRWFLSRGVPVKDAHGRTLRWYGTATDIHERKMAEEALRKANLKLQCLLDSDVVGVTLTDFEGRILEANDSFLDLVGYDREALESGFIRWDVLTPPEFGPLDQRALAELRSTGSVSPYEKQYVRKDGNRIWVLMGGALLPHEHEQAICFIIDIDKRKEAEALLHRIREDLSVKIQEMESLFEHAPAGMAMFDAREPFRLMACNPRFEEMWPESFRASGLVGKTFPEFAPQLEEAGVLEVFRDVLNSRRPQTLFAFPYDGLSRGRTWWNWTASPILHGAEIHALAFMCIEVTQEVRARNELTSAKNAAIVANRMKDEFFATLSHELRTPLSGIVGWVSLLRQSREQAERLWDTGLQRIESSAEMLTRLVDDMLDYSRVVSGKMKLELGDVNLSQVVRAVMDAVRFSAEAKQVAISFRTETSNVMLRGDEKRLQQVVSNLLSNAIKFSEPEGSVEIVLRPAGDFVRILVRDKGIGLRAEDLTAIFDRFHQAETDSSRRQTGLGLGLAIARHIVELHGGTISAQSDGLGRGTTFVVSLPLRSSGLEPVMASGDQPHPHSGLASPVAGRSVRA